MSRESRKLRPRGRLLATARPQLATYGLEPRALTRNPELDAWALPRGTHDIEPATIAALQRARLLLGMVRAVARLGYAKTRVADVIAEAQLSRKTFYQQFKDKEDCYLAAYEAGNREHVRQMVESQREGSGWRERFDDSLEAYLGFFRDRPEGTIAMIVEVHAAGDRAWALREEVFTRFARMQRGLYRIRQQEQPGLPDLSDEVCAAISAASEALVTRMARQGRCAEMMKLKPVLSKILLALLDSGAGTAR